MTYRLLQFFTVIIPTLLIGGFEYIRHHLLMPYLSMELGNLYITLLTLLLSYIFSSWMFRTIRHSNQRLVEEQARRAVFIERERLARELHDGIAQTLFFLNVVLKKGNVEEAHKAVTAIDNQVRQAIFNLRSLSEEQSFSLRLDKWLSQWSVLSGIEVMQDVTLPDSFFYPVQEVQLFGVIQEAFANIRKHAGAEHAHIRLYTTAAGGWQLYISDDGTGLQESDSQTQKYGVSMIRERAAQLGATFKIQNKVNGGTELLLTAGNGGTQ